LPFCRFAVFPFAVNKISGGPPQARRSIRRFTHLAMHHYRCGYFPSGRKKLAPQPNTESKGQNGGDSQNRGTFGFRSALYLLTF
jgi:hypothetical protein